MNDNDCFNEKTMTWTLVLETDDDEEIEVELPARFEVCDICDGKGKRVNPAIDGHGISAEEFDEDPDFREDYFAGVYDITCSECNGKRVIPVIIDDELNEQQKKALKQHDKKIAMMRELEAMEQAEKMMGA